MKAVTLRQKDDPQKEFPQEVPTLTTFPVIAGPPLTVVDSRAFLAERTMICYLYGGGYGAQQEDHDSVPSRSA